MKSEIQGIIERIKQFRDDRDWQQFHDAKNLAICLSVESSELLQNFLWKKTDDVNVENIKEELADVFYSAFLIADLYGFDIEDIISEKLQKNAIKYPIEKAKGSNKKYNEL
jgi:NTP pyrophosphatase (non-canonical NTP hydrolase)